MAIVVSHLGADVRALAAQAARQAPLADLVELRLDRVGHPGKGALADLVGAAGKPVIVTCHGPEAGGAFAGDLDARLDLLHDAAEAGARFVDVDWTLSLELGEVRAPCHRIVSRHDPEATPADLDLLLEEVQAVLYEGDVTKIVPTARTCEDGLRLLRWLRTTKGIVAFCMGEAGRFTRVLAPIFGSPFTYAAPAAVPGQPAPEAAAPGQIPVNDLRALLPPGGVSQETAVLGVVGRPIGHSFSPWVHGMALKAARLDAVYVAFEPATLEGFLALADDENYRGFSVTAPFKEEAWRLVRDRDGASDAARAVNTLLRTPEGWRGANTDVGAVRATLDAALAYHGRTPGRPVALPVVHALVLGAGGAARAAARAVRAAEGRVTIAGRDPERARRLADELGCEAVPWERVPEVAYDVLVHATPVGSRAEPDRSPVPDDWLRPGTLVLDAVYDPIRTPLLAAAHARGCTPIPGGEWFVRQAVEQFRLFTHAEPDENLMRKSFEHAHAAARPPARQGAGR